MKILQICSVRDFGGGERHVADLANSLARRGDDVFAVVNTRAQLRGALGSLPEKNIIELRMRSVANVVATEMIATLVRENNIDIIHAHAARDYPLAAIVSKRSGTPFVLTRHVLFPMKRLHKLLLNKAARVIAVSNAVANVLRTQGIFAPGKIVTIHNGIDTARFAANDRSHRAGRLRVGTVGHIAPIKGQEDLVGAAAIVLKERTDIEFVIVGKDKSAKGENEANLRRLIADLHVAENIHLLGWEEDVAGVLAGLDLFVSAARSEPFGLVILEAMAANRPLVATASQGALEIIDDGVTGLLVPVGDAHALAAAILRALGDPALCRQLTANARRKVENKFSLKGMVDATEKVYRDVLSER